MGTTISGDTGVVFPDATTQSTAVTVATPFSINASAGAGAQLRLPEATANGVNYVAVKAPDLLAGDVTWTLPTADGTNGQYLQTNGAGQLAFATVPATNPGGTNGQIQINNAGAFGALSSGTNGQILTSAGAGNAPTFLAQGTSGQVLQSAGAGAAPVWATPATGALVFISSQTVTGAPLTVDFTSGISSTYDDYFITFENVTFTSVGGNNASLAARLQQSGSFQTGSVYDFGYYGVGSTSIQVDAQVGNTYIDLMLGRSSTPAQTPRSGFIYLLNVNSTTARTCGVLTTATTRGSTNGTSSSSTSGGTSSVAAAVTGIRFISHNNIEFTAGTFRLYGIAKS